MRIYSNPHELMSETARNLWEMGNEVKPKTYQNKNIEGKDEFITKELICEQYCLTSMDDPTPLFAYTKSKDWADAEFEERISGQCINPGEAWKLRPDVWEQFLNADGKFDYTYPERMSSIGSSFGMVTTKIDNLIKLLKHDNDTRRAILDIYGGDHQVGLDWIKTRKEQRIPCSMYYDFLVRENARGEKQLNICYHQRSSDFITHFGNDVYLAWRLMEYIAREIEIQPGYLFHTIDSLHSYKRDWEKLKTSLTL